MKQTTKASKKVPDGPKDTKKAEPVKKSEQAREFPGYPPYNSKDDILNQSTRIDADLEEVKIAGGAKTSAKKDSDKVVSNEADLPTIDTEEDEKKIADDQFSVTPEDLEALGPEDLSLDMGEDEELKHRTQPVDFTAKDLDIPGSELDDDAEATGSEDEENNSYSLGGDDHNDLEESKGE